VRAVLITAVLFLAIGIGVLVAFCHGNTGVQFAWPLSAASVHVDITTTGAPAMIGLAFTLLGVLLLIVATIIALAGMRRPDGIGGPITRRQTAFEE
jgi:hypothetical protein